tara:strand:+ start:292 stop:1362 length:1071 start_codon:yes stop_codon:yes gene_type:complete
MLRENIAFIAAVDAREKKWNNDIPVVNLGYRSLINRIMTKIGLKNRQPSNEIYVNNLISVLDEISVDLIFVNFMSFAYDLRSIILKADSKIIIHTHGYDITWDLLDRNTGVAVYDRKYTDFVKKISGKALIIANSNYSKKSLLDIGVPENKIMTKNFGVPLEPQKPINNTTKVTVLFLGRLIECKGPDLVIKAFELACDKGMNGDLIIAGGGNLEFECRKLREESRYKEKIKLVGVVSPEQGEALRQSADIFTAHNCKSSTTNQVEAFGVSIIEAMAAGLPVVTGASGGVTHSIVDGETGYLFTSGDVERHANLLLKLADNPSLRQEMGARGRHRVRIEFSMEQEAKCLREALRIS